MPLTPLHLRQPDVIRPPGLRVLLADDCRASRYRTRDILYRLGIQPTLVTNGAEAVQMALEHDLDLIFMAVDLPILDGIVATARIREFESANPGRQRVPVVGLTSNEPRKVEPILIRIGMDAVLERPCGFLAISACLSRVCPMT